MNPKFEFSWILEQLSKRWQRNEFHLAWLNDRLTFPFTVTLPTISGRQLLHDFGALQDQLARLVEQCERKGVVLEMQEFQYATMGRQRLPVAVLIPSIEVLVRLVGQKKSWQAFQHDVSLLLETYPQLNEWVLGQVPLIIRHHGKWPRLLSVCHYFQRHPHPMRYLRQLDITGVDSKFIENHKPVLTLLLEQLLPEESIDKTPAIAARYTFEHRFGVLHDMPLVRFRLLDEQLWPCFGGLSDLSTPVQQLANLSTPIKLVIITENKTNFLAVPMLSESIAIFGLGYGVQLLKQIPWLTQSRMLYWGDIDTNGFAILSQLRHYFPHTESLLMDEDTLLQCRAMWGEEPAENVCRAESLAGLHPHEQQLYHKLKQHVWQQNLRLEQEYVPFSRLQTALADMVERSYLNPTTGCA